MTEHRFSKLLAGILELLPSEFGSRIHNLAVLLRIGLNKGFAHCHGTNGGSTPAGDAHRFSDVRAGAPSEVYRTSLLENLSNLSLIPKRAFASLLVFTVVKRLIVQWFGV